MNDEIRRKNKQYQRIQKHFEKHLSPEERKQRKKWAHERRNNERRAPRKHHWAALPDGAEEAGAQNESATQSFEPMRKARHQSLRAPSRDEKRTVPSVFGALRVAQVMSVHRDRATVCSDGQRFSVSTTALAEGPLVTGDEVEIDGASGQERAVRRLPRRTLLERPDPGRPERALAIAANVDLACIVVAAARPTPRPGFIDRVLIALRRAEIDPLICVNKIDLAEDARAVESLLAPYLALELPAICVSATTGQGLGELARALCGKTVVFLGPSGVGKSSLLNTLDPHGDREVRDVRTLDGKGRHTTTAADLREVSNGTRVIDTPGVRAFGLCEITPAVLRQEFLEFGRVPPCRFRNCTHVAEPDCEVRAAVERGELPEVRYSAYLRILASLLEPG